MKDKLLRQLIFGNYESLGKKGCRNYTLRIPPNDDYDRERSIKYGGNDGLICYLLKRIEKLEVRVLDLELKKKK